MKFKIKTDGKYGVALRKDPSNPCEDSVLCILKNDSIVLMNDRDKLFDLMGELEYTAVVTESGREGYVLSNALEVIA